jgi:hypothetical protein
MQAFAVDRRPGSPPYWIVGSPAAPGRPVLVEARSRGEARAAAKGPLGLPRKSRLPIGTWILRVV